MLDIKMGDFAVGLLNRCVVSSAVDVHVCMYLLPFAYCTTAVPYFI